MTINAQIGASFEALLIDAPVGKVGLLGFKLIDPANEAVLIPRRQTGITEPSPGSYYTTDTAPLTADVYLVVWDFEGVEATEDLIVQIAPIIGPRYATVTDLRNYSALVQPYDNDTLNTTLREAERWIDSYVWPADSDPDTGLKYDPLDLSVTDAIQLNYATCAQAEYILHMGPGFFMSGSTRISGGDYQESGAPKIAPKAKQHLLNGGFIRLTGKAV